MLSKQAMHQQFKAAGVNSRFIINDAGDIHNTFLLWDWLVDKKEALLGHSGCHYLSELQLPPARRYCIFVSYNRAWSTKTIFPNKD